jgi:hypothetical protein
MIILVTRIVILVFGIQLWRSVVESPAIASGEAIFHEFVSPARMGNVARFGSRLGFMPKDDPFWQMMERIWADRKAAGLTARSTEEVEARRRGLRDDVEEDIEKAGRLQEDSRRLLAGAVTPPGENP